MTAFELAGKLKLDSSEFSSSLNKNEGLFKSFGNRLTGIAKSISKTSKAALIGIGVGTAAFIKSAVTESKAFDKSMSQVAATLGKSTSEIQGLTKFARDMGSKTAFTATEAAEGLNYMALAGYDAEKSMRMLPTVLNLAAAGNMQLADASDMVTDAQSALGLSISETETMVDQMAKTSSKTNTSVAQLGAAFLTVGGTAKKLKGGTAELSALLGVLANNGIKGAEGGTALRNVLTEISKPAGKAAKELKKLKIDAYDKQGNLRSMTDILSEFGEKTKDMTTKKRTDMFAKMFNVRDLKSVEALLSMTREDWAALTGEIKDSEGAADEMAKTQLDNLAGDMTIFGSALSEAKLAIMDGLTPALRTLTKNGTEWVTSLTNGFKKDGLSGAIKNADLMLLKTSSRLARNKNPFVKFIGQSLLAFRKGFNWKTFGGVIKNGWKLIQDGAAKLGGLIFGKNEKGEVNWPTWKDVQEKAEEKWQEIKDGAKELGGLIFGQNPDGSIKWPTWNDVKAKALEAWNTIRSGAKKLGGLIFGNNPDGSIKWPTWKDVQAKAIAAWNTIRSGAKKLGGLIFGNNPDGSIKWPTWKDVRAKAVEAWNSIRSGAKKLGGLIFGDTTTASQTFSNLLKDITDLKEKVEDGAIDIGKWFFGDENSETVVTSVKEISNAITAIGTAIAAITVTEGITKFLAMFKKGGEFAKIFGAGGTLATFLSENKLGIIIGSIAFVLMEIIQHWDEIEPKLEEFGTWITKYILPPLQEIATWINENIIQPIADIIAQAKQFLGIGETGSGGKLNNDARDFLKNKWDAGGGRYTPQFGAAVEKKLSGAGATETEIEQALSKLKSGEIDNSNIDAFLDSLTKIETEAPLVGEAGEDAGKSVKKGMDKSAKAAATAKGEVEALGEQISGLPDKKNIDITVTPHVGGILGAIGSMFGLAKGEPTIPYDNYLARLHRGEMVLTKSQARQYREGTSSNFDPTAMSASIVAAVREGMAGAQVNSFLSGKKVTDDSNRRTSNMLRARRFATT